MTPGEAEAALAMRDAWSAGGAASALAPASWRALTEAMEPQARERVLLALAGQALDVAFRPAADRLDQRAPLPALAAPILPERLRPLLRAALLHAGDAAGRRRVVALVAARGHVVPPLDWMPAENETEAPAIYAPWLDWVAAAPPRARDEALSAETWGDFAPAERRRALAALRAADPAAARALLEAKAGEEAAEARLALIELLTDRLGADDAPYLETLAADRSGKVRALAARLLARLGRGAGVGEEARELAAFIETTTTGLWRRRKTFAARPLTSNAQLARRAELFAACALGDLAAALGGGEADLVEGWTLDASRGVDQHFAAMVAASGGAAAAIAFAARLEAAGEVALYAGMLPRLDADAPRRLTRMALALGNSAALLSARDLPLGAFAAGDLLGSPDYAQARARLAEAAPLTRGPTPDFSLFGALASAPAAAALLADLAPLGVGPADPALALLRLNAALDVDSRSPA